VLVPQAERQAVLEMREKLTTSQRRACGFVGLSRTTLRREIAKEPETVARKAPIVDLAHVRRRFAYRRIHDLLRPEGIHANHKKIYRLYACVNAVSAASIK
jgi:putative transposase